MFPSNGAVTSTAVAVRPEMAQPSYRWLWLKAWVTAPGLMSTTSAIAPGVAVFTENGAPWATVAGEPVIVGRGLKKYEGRYLSLGVTSPCGSPPMITLPSGGTIPAPWDPPPYLSFCPNCNTRSG